jgi:hypothetical protein
MIGRMATLSLRGNGDGHVVGDYTPPGGATSRTTGPSLFWAKLLQVSVKFLPAHFLKSISSSVT